VRRATSTPSASLTPAREDVARDVRRRVPQLLCDLSGAPPGGVAIYSLSDPRELRAARYIGRTCTPRRRLLQHVGTARLWLPDALPWWVSSPKLRPLYMWLRQLYADGGRLPVLVVHEWVAEQDAPCAERRHIFECLGQGLELLNFEAELLRRQLVLPLIVPRDAAPCAVGR
jgi:hypothetical protein